MESIGNNNFGGSSPFVSPAGGPSAPPPPPEVKVRTMRSDLESMAKSGGGLPRFENVRVAGLSMGKEQPNDPVQPTPGGGGAQNANTRKNSGIILLVIFAALAILAIVGYFAYKFFLGGNGTTPPAAVTQPTLPTQPVTPTPVATTTPTTTTATAPFTHASLFVKQPADQTLTLTLSSGTAVLSSADLESFDQKLTTLLTSAKKTSSVIEIDVQDANGNGIPVGTILAQANVPVLDPSLLAALSPDATLFVYQDKNGFWPGYVMALNAGQSSSALASDTQNIEASTPSISGFFLQNVGSPSPDGFTDSAVSSTSVRVLPFLNSNIPAYFLYGWYGNYLILSTSENGFIAAMNRL